MWSKIKLWFANLWLRLKAFGRRFSAYWVSALTIVLMVIVAGAWLINEDSMDNRDSRRNPQIAQVFEPSIGEPLAPTTEPYDANKENSDNSPKVEEIVGGRPIGEGQGKVAGDFTAPETGVNLSSIIEYSNNKLGFRVELPVGTTAKEVSESSVEFLSQDNSALYTAQSYGQTSETIESLLAQIKGSTTVKTAKIIEFNGKAAVEFTAQNIPGTGLAIINNNRLFYLIGNQTFFKTFAVI